MLKQMKTANQLGIQEWEFTRLIEVRDLLQTKTLKHSKQGNSFYAVWSLPVGFNMGYAHQYTEGKCGTVGCIGGWMAINQGFNEIETNHYVDMIDGSLKKLFYPPEDRDESDVYVPYNDITPEQAVQAINNFLYDGDPNWELVLCDNNHNREPVFA